jgi:hypothetical protein
MKLEVHGMEVLEPYSQSVLNDLSEYHIVCFNLIQTVLKVCDLGKHCLKSNGPTCFDYITKRVSQINEIRMCKLIIRSVLQEKNVYMFHDFVAFVIFQLNNLIL